MIRPARSGLASRWQNFWSGVLRRASCWWPVWLTSPASAFVMEQRTATARREDRSIEIQLAGTSFFKGCHEPPHRLRGLAERPRASLQALDMSRLGLETEPILP